MTEFAISTARTGQFIIFDFPTALTGAQYMGIHRLEFDGTLSTQPTTTAWRNNIISNRWSTPAIDAAHQVSTVFQSNQPGLWISAAFGSNFMLPPPAIWQRLYVQLTSPITLTNVRITNVATGEHLLQGSMRVGGASYVQVLVKTSDPRLWDQSFMADIVYQGALSDSSVASRGRLKPRTDKTFPGIANVCHHNHKKGRLHHLRFPRSVHAVRMYGYPTIGV